MFAFISCVRSIYTVAAISPIVSSRVEVAFCPRRRDDVVEVAILRCDELSVFVEVFILYCGVSSLLVRSCRNCPELLRLLLTSEAESVKFAWARRLESLLLVG